MLFIKFYLYFLVFFFFKIKTKRFEGEKKNECEMRLWSKGNPVFKKKRKNLSLFFLNAKKEKRKKRERVKS